MSPKQETRDYQSELRVALAATPNHSPNPFEPSASGGDAPARMLRPPVHGHAQPERLAHIFFRVLHVP